MSIGIGIEIGPEVVRAVIVARSTETQPVKLISMAQRPCDSTSAHALTQALAQLRETLHITQSVVVGLPSTSAMLATLAPLIPNSRRADLAVQFELQQLLPFDVQQSAWHYNWLKEGNNRFHTRSGFRAQGSETLSRAPSPEPNTLVLIAAIKRSLLEEKLACCRRAGLLVHAVTVHALAALNSWTRLTPQPQENAILIHVNTPYSAEWIAQTPSGVHVIPVVSDSSTGLVDLLVNAWQTLQTKLSGTPSIVHLMNSGGNETVLQDTLRERLHIPIESFEALRPGCSGTALGLALQGLGLGPLKVNLVWASQREQQARMLRRISWGLSGVCALAAIGLGAQGMLELSSGRARVLHALEERERLYQTLRPEVRTLLQRQEHLQQRTQQLETLIQESPQLTQMFADVVRALPDTVWLTKVEWTKAAAIDGVIEGRATSFQDITRLMEGLKQIAGMSSVKLLSAPVSADESSKRDVISFTIHVQRSQAPIP